MRISDWSSDVRSSDRLHLQVDVVDPRADIAEVFDAQVERPLAVGLQGELLDGGLRRIDAPNFAAAAAGAEQQYGDEQQQQTNAIAPGSTNRRNERLAEYQTRTEDQTSQLQSLMRNSNCVIRLNTKKITKD